MNLYAALVDRKKRNEELMNAVARTIESSIRSTQLEILANHEDRRIHTYVAREIYGVGIMESPGVGIVNNLNDNRPRVDLTSARF